MKLRLLVVIATVALAAFACSIETLMRASSLPRPPHGSFAARMQPTAPTDAVRVAGVGTVQELRPVEIKGH
jgi:hypothetical protein